MNKQEFQQTIKNMKPPKFFTAITLNEAYEAGFEEAKGNALCNSCFLNEPEKPVVPQFVADWYEDHKDNFEFNVQCLRVFNCEPVREIDTWFDSDDTKPIETLVMMHKFGYEVEKDKLYTVEIPNPNSDNHLVLRKDFSGKVCFSLLHSEYWRGNESTRLTEAEIKKDFDWTWQFAKEVE